jgi:DNA-binding protein Fis
MASILDVFPEDEEERRRRAWGSPLSEFMLTYPGRYVENLKQIPGMLEYPVSFQEREERGMDPYEGVVSHTLGALPQAAWQAFPFLPVMKDLSGMASQAVSSLSESIANIFNTPEMAVEAGTVQPIVESALSMMVGGKGGRPKGGGIWPKGKKGRELESVARREDKAKRLVTPLVEADAPPETTKSTDSTGPTPYTTYIDRLDAELEVSRIKLRDYSKYQPYYGQQEEEGYEARPNITNPDAVVDAPVRKFDWRSGDLRWQRTKIPKVELSEAQRTHLEDTNNRNIENFKFWNDRVEKLEELAGQLENAESGFRSADRKWMDRIGGPIFPFKDSRLPGYLFESEFENLFKDLDIQADDFFERATPQEERARLERERIAEEGIKGKKQKFVTERKIQVSGGVKISDDEYNLGLRQEHFNKDGSLTLGGARFLREHDIQVQTLAERNASKSAPPDKSALGRFAEIKRREEEKILHELGRLRERERDWEEYRRVGRTLDPDAPAGEMEQQMERSYEESLARDQVKREYYESLAGKESEEYMKYLQGELKRLKAGKITDDLESVTGRQTQATKIAGINRHKAPPTWEHYWANLFKTPDTPVDELMSRVDPSLKGKNLVDAVTEALMEDETDFIDPFSEQTLRGGFPRFYSQYREYLIEGPQGKEVTFHERATDPTIKSYEEGEQLTGPLDESQIELKLDRLMDLSRRRYRAKAEKLLLENGYITEDDKRMRWED